MTATDEQIELELFERAAAEEERGHVSSSTLQALSRWSLPVAMREPRWVMRLESYAGSHDRALIAAALLSVWTAYARSARRPFRRYVDHRREAEGAGRKPKSPPDYFLKRRTGLFSLLRTFTRNEEDRIWEAMLAAVRRNCRIYRSDGNSDRWRLVGERSEEDRRLKASTSFDFRRFLHEELAISRPEIELPQDHAELEAALVRSGPPITCASSSWSHPALLRGIFSALEIPFPIRGATIRELTLLACARDQLGVDSDDRGEP